MDKIVPIDIALSTSGHSSMYIMHKFFARKQADIIREYINSHSLEKELILDPFCGSGVVVGEALRLNRRVIGIDINPVSIFITRNTIKCINTDEIAKEFEKIKSDVANDINKLYLTKCRICNEIIPAICFTWDNDKLYDVRYECPQHGRRIDQILPEDLKLQTQIAEKKITSFFDLKGNCYYWYPVSEFFYRQGIPFLKKERFDSVNELFTIRNLVSLAKLYSRIKMIANNDIQEAFKFAFSSITHLASKMTPVRPTRPFSSAWVQQSYWFCTNNMESNVWNLFERSILGKQGLIKAKLNIPVNFKELKEAQKVHEIYTDDEKDFLLLETTIISLDEIKENSIDYIITDPPYGHSIQYGELLYMWGSWLGLMDNFDEIARKEIVKNLRQNKGDNEYEQMLTKAFNNIFRVLKPGRYCTVTFHNPSLKYRNILYRSLIKNGFILEKIVYQPPARPSAKSLLQPFGSLEGDYFFRFKKPKDKQLNKYKPISKIEYEELIVKIAKKIIREQKGPVHYTYLQNSIDPLLYTKLQQSNLLMNFQPKDIETTLKKYLGQIFQLVDMEAIVIGKQKFSCKGWSLIDFNE